MMNIDRRTALKTASWAAPAFITVGKAPAYATSEQEDCKPKWQTKTYDKKTKTWTYKFKVEVKSAIISVTIAGKKLSRDSRGYWIYTSKQDSRTLTVTVKTMRGTQVIVVPFG